MSDFASLIIAVTVLLFSQFCYATYSPTSKANVALYWGQGSYQQRLLHFCQQSTVDIIPIGFVDIFPAQGNGFPGTNFGNQCSGPHHVYSGPGSDPTRDQLQADCPQLKADIPLCQSAFGKKIILSLGGGLNTYQLTGATQGVEFANFLWGAFGPQTSAWIAQGLPRPFDGPGNAAVEVDGFDFDIEYPSTDSSAGYIAMINRLRSLFTTAQKPYLITGAPQCIVPDANMGQMISAVQFDILFIQYYNTPQCSARSWVTSNPNYLSTGKELPNYFTFNSWANSLVGTASANAKLYIGLVGDMSESDYLNADEMESLVKAYFCKPNFGGVMIWEATVAEINPAGPYYTTVKNALTSFLQDNPLSCDIGPSSTSTILTLVLPTTESISPISGSIIIKQFSESQGVFTSKTTFATTTSKLTSTSATTSTFSTTSTTTSSSTLSSTTKSSSTSKLTSTSTLISTTKLVSTSTPISSSTLSSTTKVVSTSQPITGPKFSSTSSSSSSTSRTTSTTSKPATSSKLSTPSTITTSIKAPACSTPPRSSTPPSSSTPTSSSTPPSSSTPTSSSTPPSSSTPTSSSKAATSATPTLVIPAGACGAPYGNSCGTGMCCSQYGYCGSGSAWCGSGCQWAFGMCWL